MDPDMAPGGSRVQDSDHGPGGITSYIHQAVPHYPPVASSTSFHCAHILLSLSFPCLLYLLAPFSGAQGI